MDSDEVGGAAAASEHASLSFNAAALLKDVPIKMLPSPLEK